MLLVDLYEATIFFQNVGVGTAEVNHGVAFGNVTAESQLSWSLTNVLFMLLLIYSASSLTKIEGFIM